MRHYIFNFEITKFEYTIPQEDLHAENDQEINWETTLQLVGNLFNERYS